MLSNTGFNILKNQKTKNSKSFFGYKTKENR